MKKSTRYFRENSNTINNIRLDRDREQKFLEGTLFFDKDGYVPPRETSNQIRSHYLNINNVFIERMWFLDIKEKRSLMEIRLFEKNLHYFIKYKLFSKIDPNKIKNWVSYLMKNRTQKILRKNKIHVLKGDKRKNFLVKKTSKYQSVISENVEEKLIIKYPYVFEHITYIQNKQVIKEIDRLVDIIFWDTRMSSYKPYLFEFDLDTFDGENVSYFLQLERYINKNLEKSMSKRYKSQIYDFLSLFKSHSLIHLIDHSWKRKY